MSEKETEIWEAITSVLNRTGTNEQNTLFNQWMDESEENRKIFEVLSKVRRVKNPPSEMDKEDVYERIHAVIKKGRSDRRISWIKYGNIASILIFVSLSLTLLWPKSEPKVVNNIETRSPLGTKSKVTLSDGTTVYLNSGSVLEYPPVFSDRFRNVKLTGEAFFEVAREKNREFIVNTGDINIKVFGTRFNVKNYDTDKAIETTLVEGSVGIMRKDDEPLMLKPDEQAVFEKQTRKLYSRKLDAELVSIWKEGKHFFENETFETIAQKMEREFNIPVKINSKELRNEVFTGMFDKNKTIYQMLDLMKRKRDFSYKEINDTIVITKK